jgi:hypothetical protein
MGCVSGQIYSSGTCDGSGGCNEGAATSCNPYTCNAQGCLATCNSNADCFSNAQFCYVVPGYNIGVCHDKAVITSLTHTTPPARVNQSETFSASYTSSPICPSFIASCINWEQRTWTVIRPDATSVAVCPNFFTCSYTPTQIGTHTIRFTVGTSAVVQDQRDLIVEVAP